MKKAKKIKENQAPRYNKSENSPEHVSTIRWPKEGSTKKYKEVNESGRDHFEEMEIGETKNKVRGC